MSTSTADLRALVEKWRGCRTVLGPHKLVTPCAHHAKAADELHALIVKSEAEPQSDGPPEIPANILAYLEREQERLKGLTSAQILAELRGAAKSQGVCEGGRPLIAATTLAYAMTQMPFKDDDEMGLAQNAAGVLEAAGFTVKETTLYEAVERYRSKEGDPEELEPLETTVKLTVSDSARNARI